MRDAFAPKFFFRNPHLQTLLGRSKYRLNGVEELHRSSTASILPCGEGVRLLGFHARRPEGASRGLVALIHGWEGSADSTYILAAGAYLFRRGFDIFRLNLRDHGESHHLNAGLFHGALIGETFQALRNIAHLPTYGRLYLIGFSLGGNFALRIALKHGRKEEIPSLRHVFAVSPALDPYKATMAIDAGWGVYRRYFLNKWKRSLKKKQALFPDLYDFRPMMKTRSCLELTEAIMVYYREYRDYHDYFRQYTLDGASFAGLSVPTTIIVSRDDPVIPLEDFHALPAREKLHVAIQPYGGHCGFIDMPGFSSWCDRKIYDIIDQS
ncbi:MAG: alpha/beta fold hydrolase [Pseudomonadota bacterium]|nr:alpha/beta fold hydrolase [Pseudomonadota bacterium]